MERDPSLNGEYVTAETINHFGKYLAVSRSMLGYGKSLGIGTDETLLYALLRERCQLSVRNRWFDSEGYYIYYTRAEAANYLRWSLRKTVTVFQNLIQIGLLREKDTSYPNGKHAAKKLYLRAWIEPTMEYRLDDFKAGRFPPMSESTIAPGAGGDYLALPKILLEEERYCHLSQKAVLLYTLILATLNLSVRFEKIDDMGRPWATVKPEMAMELIGCKSRSLTSAYAELEEIGLIEREIINQTGLWRIYARPCISDQGIKHEHCEALNRTDMALSRKKCTTAPQNLHDCLANSACPDPQKLHSKKHPQNKLSKRKLSQEKASCGPPGAADDIWMISHEKEGYLVNSQQRLGGESRWLYYDETFDLLHGNLKGDAVDMAVDLLEKCCHIMERDKANNHPYIMVGKNSVCRQDVLQAYGRIDSVIMFILLQKVCELYETIKDMEPYLRSALFQASKQHKGYAIRLRREWQYYV